MAELSKLGRYELRRILGRGAMGVVYEGFDPTLSRRVAIKTILKSVALDPETERAYSARFAQEAKAIARLNHTNIVQVHDFGVEGEIAYLVMEFIKGRELRSFFEAKEKFDAAEAVRIMGELLDALEFAHGAGVIHRDVKPANVMLDTQRRVKLADFGVARIQDSDRSMGGTMVGTPAFMSPEQIQGRKVDRRTDLFSAGTILYHLLTGEQPFKGEGAWTVAKKIIEDDPTPPSRTAGSVSSVFDEIVNKALAKKPERRFGSAREFAAALRGSLGNARLQPQPAASAETKPKSRTETKASETELEFWRSIQNRDDLDELELYVEQFPSGAYTQLARLKIAKLRSPLETSRKDAEEKAKREAEERVREEAEEKKNRDMEEKARLEAEAVARRAAEEKARHEAQELAKREAEAKTKREAEAKARREAEERSLRDALEKAKREAAEKAKREAEEKARQARALAKLRQQEETTRSQPAVADPDSTVAIGQPMAAALNPPAETKTSFVMPAIIGAVVIGGGVVAILALNRTPAPAPAPVAEVPSKPATPSVDEEKIRRDVEQHLRREFSEKAATEKAQMEKVVAEKVAAEKVAAEKLANAKTAAEKETAEKAAQKAAAERVAAEKAAAEKTVASKAAAEKILAEKAMADKLAAEKSAAEKASAEKAAAEKAAAERSAAEKATAEKALVAKASPATVTRSALPAVGDRWVYEVRETNRPEKRYEAAVEVLAVTPLSVRDIYKLPGGKNTEWTHKPGAYIVRIGDVPNLSPYLGVFEDLREGQRWQDVDSHQFAGCSSGKPGNLCQLNARVIRRENVTVKAGTYDAWMILVEESAPFQGREHTYWFARESKRVVKYQMRFVRGIRGFGLTDIDMELVSYTPGKTR